MLSLTKRKHMTLQELGNDARLVNAVRNTLSVFPHEPFLCLPMSCCLLASLEHDCPEYSLAVKTGNLLYKNHIVFKQECDLNSLPQQNINTSWDGHAWLEINDQFIIDLSLGRTIASPQFVTPYRDEILPLFGGKIVVIDKLNNNVPLHYQECSVLGDPVIAGVIQGAYERFCPQS